MGPLQLNKATKRPFKQFEFLYTGLSLRVGGRISPGYYVCGPQLLLLENRWKLEPKDIPSCLIPLIKPTCLLYFPRQFEILEATLLYITQTIRLDILRLSTQQFKADQEPGPDLTFRVWEGCALGCNQISWSDYSCTNKSE